jgi:hypothetical protein
MPHAKAYHLWDTSTGQIFNSFHVTFIEHLDEQPANLLPGMIVDLNPNTPPSWDNALPNSSPPHLPAPTLHASTFPPTIPPTPHISQLPFL